MNLQKQIETYQMSESAMQVLKATRVLLIASIVGGGKDTVVKELVKTGYYHRIVSHTTRLPRENHGQMEIDSVDYHFIDPPAAEAMINAQAFIEAKLVHGNVYGTSVSELEAAAMQDKIAVTDIDIQGVVEYLDAKQDTHAVFLLPPSVETWLDRLARRYGDLATHEDEIKRRFKTAYDEITHIQQDERFVLVVNDDLDTTVERVRGVVMGEVSRTSGYADKTAEHLLDYIETRLS